jgi:hypothetical protein
VCMHLSTGWLADDVGGYCDGDGGACGDESCRVSAFCVDDRQESLSSGGCAVCRE